MECYESCWNKRGLCKAVKIFYEKNVIAIKISNKISEGFRVTKGPRQGCAMAPTLFKIYINEALKKVENFLWNYGYSHK